MNHVMGELLDQLDRVPCRTNEYELMNLLEKWSSRTGLALIREAMSELLSEAAVVDRIRVTARETSTHYVWPLYLGKSGCGLVINEFKDPPHMATGYAKTLHNHRYSFASLVLSGGYKQVRSRVDLAESGQSVRVRTIGQDDIIRGSIVAVNHQDFHQLTHISDHTMTLLAKCPAVKESSISVDIDTLRVSRHVPVEARLVQLRTALIATDMPMTSESELDARFA
jgi:hypothetical protein